MIPGSVQPRPAKADSGIRRVLVVDEALPVRRTLAEILSRAGLGGGQVRAVATAEDALEAFALEPPDIVFAELVGEDSTEGLRMVTEMLALDPLARIVLVTAESASSPLVRRAIRAGVFGIVAKPLRQDKVRAVLSEIESEEGNIERFR